MSRPLARVIATIVVALGTIASCAPAAPSPGAGARGPAPSPPAPLAPAPVPAGAQGDAECSDATDCGTCTARLRCRFCTEPRACLPAGAHCPGLSLGHPSSCGNDPAEAARRAANELELRRQATLAAAAGMTPEGASVEAHLEHMSTVELPVAAGRCHTLLWRLADGATPGDVRIALEFVTPRSTRTGTTAFDVETRVGAGPVLCSAYAGTTRFRVVDRSSMAPVAAAGRGGIALWLFGRPMTPADAGDPSAPAPPPAAPPRAPPPQAPPAHGGTVGVDCLDCTFPCTNGAVECKRRCFVDERERGPRATCERTCDQIARACLRGCPGCW